jgi:hypothetical protein
MIGASRAAPPAIICNQGVHFADSRSRLFPYFGQSQSCVAWQRSHDRLRIYAAATRLHDEELFSVATGRYFGTSTFERRVRIVGHIDAFDHAAIVAGLANDLRKLTFAKAGRRNRLGYCYGGHE